MSQMNMIKSLRREAIVLAKSMMVYIMPYQAAKCDALEIPPQKQLARIFAEDRVALVTVQTRTVITWQGKRFRDPWAELSKQGRPGRPPLPKEIRALIRKMLEANSGWGSPRIVGELRKLGIAFPKPQLTIVLMFRPIE
jgi:hypothetical protein